MKNKQVIMVIAAALVAAAGIGFGAAKLSNNNETHTESSEITTEQSAAPASATAGATAAATSGATSAADNTASPNATTSNPTTADGAQTASDSEEAVITTTPPATSSGVTANTNHPSGAQHVTNAINNAAGTTTSTQSTAPQQTGTAQPTTGAQTSASQPCTIRLTDASNAPYSIGIYTGYADICDHLKLSKQDPSSVANGKSVVNDYKYGQNYITLCFDKAPSGNLELGEFQVGGNHFLLEDGTARGDSLDQVRDKYESTLGKAEIKYYRNDSAEMIFNKDNIRYVLYFTIDSNSHSLLLDSYRVTRVDLEK
ncbi:MAG: hypothetical protein K6D38_07745 [Pseudobutyrivibrio sp.]|nr:hypothetical protein [Pseudobutyrivibrio sp.]